jgi:hypothetical protein
MHQWSGNRLILVITACLNHQGIPQFVRNDVEATQDEYKIGLHLDLVEHCLKASGYSEPFVHFDQFDSQRFLLDAITESVGQATKLPESIRHSALDDPS